MRNPDYGDLKQLKRYAKTVGQERLLKEELKNLKEFLIQTNHGNLDCIKNLETI